MTTIGIFAVAGLITYLLRSFMLLFGNRITSSPAIQSAIGLVSPAVLAAVVASALLVEHGEISGPDLPTVFAVAGAAIAVRRTANVGLALAVGLPIYWIFSAALSSAGFG